MNKHSHETKSDRVHIADDVSAVITSATNAVGDHLAGASKSVDATLDKVRTAALSVREKTIKVAKTTHAAVQKNPYPAIAIGIGAGVLIGMIIGRRKQNRS